MKQWWLEKLLLPLGDSLLGHPMMKRLVQLRQAQWWHPLQIEKCRSHSLQRLVRTAAAEVPFYRELLAKANVPAVEIRHTKDLRRLPVVTKSALRTHYPQGTCRTTRQQTYQTSTSGSTGRNFWVREDHETAGWYRASFMLALEWAGWSIGESHLQNGITTKRNWERRLKDLLLGCHYFPAYQLDDQTLDGCLELLEKKRVRHLWGYPSSLYYLAQRAQKVGFNHSLASVVTWGDQLFPHYRTTIESAFKVRVHDTYGCGEGFQIAAQCNNTSHYHIHSMDVIVELLDDTGQPVVEGQPGNVVITRLHAGPMPFIRYQVGDIAIGGGPEQCSCGRGYALLKSVVGRTADVITTPSGNRLVVHFFTGVLEHFPEIDTFQVVQNNPESILVRIVPRQSFATDTVASIRSSLHAKGADLQIAIETVAEIPLTAGGKRRFIISQLHDPLPKGVHQSDRAIATR